MKDKKENNQTKKEIDNQADVRAGGFHEVQDTDFEQTQVPNKPSKKDFKQHQQKNSKDTTNKNYGWKEGFDHSESYGSELNKKPNQNSK